MDDVRSDIVCTGFDEVFICSVDFRIRRGRMFRDVRVVVCCSAE